MKVRFAKPKPPPELCSPTATQRTESIPCEMCGPGVESNNLCPL